MVSEVVRLMFPCKCGILQHVNLNCSLRCLCGVY